MTTKKTVNTSKSGDLFTHILTAVEQSPHRPFDISLCTDFLRLYYSDVNIEDLKDYSPEDLANAAGGSMSYRAPGIESATRFMRHFETECLHSALQ